MKKGYIYGRMHESFEKYNAFKLGITENIPERDSSYVQNEIERGFFFIVFEVSLEEMRDLEKKIFEDFIKYHIKRNGGTEFYHIDIIPLLEPYLKENKVQFRKLSDKEIENLERKSREYRIKKKLETNIEEYTEKYIKKYNIDKSKHIVKHPRDYQITIIEESVSYFEDNNKGILSLICGIGKTLISLWITQYLGSKKILIGVPRINLLEQWEKEIIELFPDIKILIISCKSDNTSDGIKKFLKDNDKCIVISSYSSIYKVLKVTKKIDYIFDMKILDEVHHLTTENMVEETQKKFVEILKIQSIKQLSLTATLKKIECEKDDLEIVSNENIEYFGGIISERALFWAINKEIICDYDLITTVTDDKKLEYFFTQFNIKSNVEQRFFLSGYIALKSISENKVHHLIIYSNTKGNALKIVDYIKMLLDAGNFTIPDLFFTEYHSEIKTKTQQEYMDNFMKSKFGILSCVYCLGEGWDCPLLDGVLFAENMSSNIRIVQSALRASRKNILEPNKKAKIILPILNNFSDNISDKNNWIGDNNNSDYKKIQKVIYHLSLVDESIEQKLKVSMVNPDKQNSKSKEKITNKNLDEFGEIDNELTNKLRLNIIPRTALGTSFTEAKKIIASKKIKSKQAYFELCEKNNKLPTNPKDTYKKKFTNWIDYLGIERNYYELEDCKNKVKEYLDKHPELKEHNLDLVLVSKSLSEIDTKFPAHDLWVEYYNVTLEEIINLKNEIKKKKIPNI